MISESEGNGADVELVCWLNPVTVLMSTAIMEAN
jgi:hypothetical protein